MATLLLASLRMAGVRYADGSAALTDVGGTAHESAILALADLGVVRGRSDGSFRPSAPITRGQVATMLVAAAELLGTHQTLNPEPPMPTDVSGAAHAEAILRAIQLGLAQGYSDGTFGPSDLVTRAQASTLLMALLKGSEGNFQISANLTEDGQSSPHSTLGTPLGTSSRLSQHGITWTFTSEHEYGT